MSTYQVQAPFTLQYYAQWRSVLSMKSIRREPIEPPEGYENVSMAPYPSSSDVEKDEENGPVEEPPVPPEIKEPDSEPPPPTLENRNTEDTSPVWPYLLVVLVLVGTVVVLLRSRKGKPDR